jgi:hypothetical protein
MGLEEPEWRTEADFRIAVASPERLERFSPTLARWQTVTSCVARSLTRAPLRLRLTYAACGGMEIGRLSIGSPTHESG